MKQCSVCHKESKKTFRIYNGVICENCYKYIPEGVNIRQSDVDYLRELCEKRKNIADKFEATAYFGNLYLDSIHCMLCYSKRGKKGTPLSLGDVYKITELKDIGFYLSDVKSIGDRIPKITCNVKLKVVTSDINAEYIIAKDKRCQIEKVNEGKIHYNEPAEIIVIKDLLRQMFEDVYSGLSKRLNDILRLQEISETLKNTQWAKGILFLEDEEYSAAEIKTQYKTLSRMFHPDLHPDISDCYMKMLNSAYEILIKGEQTNEK